MSMQTVKKVKGKLYKCVKCEMWNVNVDVHVTVNASFKHVSFKS